MLDSTPAYQAAITGDHRWVLLKAIIDIIDPDLKYGATRSSGDNPLSCPEQLRDRVFAGDEPYITLERNRWLLNGTFRLPWKTYQMGSVLDQLSGDDGSFATPQWVEEPFTGVSILQACSVYFPTARWDGVPDTFTVDIRQGGTVLYSQAFTGNRADHVSLKGFTVYDPEAIRVTVTKWSLPGRYMRTMEIIPGVYEEWDSSILSAFSVTQQANFSCLSLPYGTCVLSMDNLDRRFEPRSKDGVFQSLEDRQGIDIRMGVKLEDGTEEFKRLGIYYQHSGGWKTGSNGLTMEWTLVDMVGLLARRTFFPPETLPTTLEGWIRALAAQLGRSFEDRYMVDPAYADLPVTAGSVEAVTGRTCGEILRWACMATGTWPRADGETGYLAVEPYWSQGNQITLDNLDDYPTLKSNDDLAAITFVLSDNSRLTVSGTATSAGDTVTVRNPFLHTREQALAAARQILSTCGGNKIETTGRGDPASEIGDVDTVWLDHSQATTGRRMMQTFRIREGVLQGCRSTLLQADGAALYQSREVLTESGTWTAPEGVTFLRIILVGKGSDGQPGTDGTYDTAGEDGADGAGGKVWAGTVNINPGQTFAVTIGADTVLGNYSSAQGQVFPYGYTDVASGDCWGRTGVEAPQPGSGDGGKGGKGGFKGFKRVITGTVPILDPETGEITYEEREVEVIDVNARFGQPGSVGAIGCAVIYWDKEDVQ